MTVVVTKWEVDEEGQVERSEVCGTLIETSDRRAIPWDLIHAVDRERVRRKWQRVFAQREPFSVRYRLLCLDGCYRWAEHVGQPRWHQDAFRGYEGTIII